MTVTETAVPKGASFQDWQADQLQSLADALATSAGPTAPLGSTVQVPAAASGGAAQAPDAATAGAASSAAPPSSGLARTGSSARWLVLLAGVMFVLGGLGLAGGIPARRPSPSRSA